MEIRTDPVTGARVAMADGRQDRPNRPAVGCPFCVGGIEAREPYVAKAFVNRWPSFPDDRCEVVLYTPDHDATFWSLGVAGARTVVDLWAERTATLGARADVAYVLIFENRGAEVGATIAHPHGQIFAFDDVPPAPRAELGRARAGAPLLADAAALTVVERDGWRVWVPSASPYPYGLRIAPLAPRPDLPALDDAERNGLAAVLVDALARLDRLFDAPMPYMLWIHQRPTDGGAWPAARLHVEIAPPLRGPGAMRYVAAGELGSGTFVNPVLPEHAAEQLRGAGR
ncbi:galactose-1-phosphate uridylyltransferase [soil metagenome]